MTSLLERERSENVEAMEKTIKNHNEATEKQQQESNNAYELL